VACATVSIESFDVEPIDHRTVVRWLLGLLAAFTGALAIIGWPLPAAPGRYVRADAWERTTALIEAWWSHDGWRMSGASWFWGGVAIGATTGVIMIGAAKERPWRRTWLLTVLPGGVIAALGPLVQVLLGIRWSNYSKNHDSRSTIIVYAIGLAVAVGLPFLREWVVRGREKSDGDGALRP
jgi:hypothetical protein